MYLVCAKHASINLIHLSIKVGSHPTGLLLSSHWVGKWINQILAPLQTIGNSVMNESELWVGADSSKLRPSLLTQQHGNLRMQSTQRGIATLMQLPITWDAHGGYILPMDRSLPRLTQAFHETCTAGGNWTSDHRISERGPRSSITRQCCWWLKQAKFCIKTFSTFDWCV